MTRRDAARLAGAAALGTAAFTLLVRGGAAPLAAGALATGATCFALWRTIPGVLAAFALLAGSAALAAPSGGFAWAPSIERPALGLAAFAIGTLGVTTAVSARGWPSRRFLGAVLAPCGLLLAGLVLASAARTVAIGSALVVGALAYWLGTVPAFAWAPLLLRHERDAVAVLGLAVWLATATVLWWVVPRLPAGGVGAARLTLLILGAVSLPWGAWCAWRKRRSDPRCARSYLLVVAGAVVVLSRALTG